MSCLDRKHFLLAVLLVTLSVSVGCSHFERLKIPFTHKADRRVRDKELVRIDNRVYVKVRNPEGQTELTRGQHLYVPVKEYLANREAYDSAPVVTSTAPPQEDEWSPVGLETESPLSKGAPANTGQMAVSPHFKKRLMVVPFKDEVNSGHKKLSDIVTRSLVLKVQATSDQVILFDAEIMKQALRGRKIDFESFESPEALRLANQLFNIHAIVTGTIDHFFTSSTESKIRGKDRTAYAIAEISAKLVDTASGRTLRLWEKRNPIFDSEEKGDFSEEKARLKAIDLITSELGMEINDELKRISWYTTIAGIDGNRVYISAGKLSGVRIGDVFSVYAAASPEDPKGEIRVAGLFGIDSSVAEITEGNGFKANDTVKPVLR